MHTTLPHFRSWQHSLAPLVPFPITTLADRDRALCLLAPQWSPDQLAHHLHFHPRTMRSHYTRLGFYRRPKGGANHCHALPHLRIPYRGVTKYLREWAADPSVNIHQHSLCLLYHRLVPIKGTAAWTPEAAFTTPNTRRTSCSQKKH